MSPGELATLPSEDGEPRLLVPPRNLPAKEERHLPTPVQTWTREQIELVKKTVAKDATDDELELFLYHCKKTGLDPLCRQIHFIKRRTKDGPRVCIQTGIDGYRAVAERKGLESGMPLAGIEDPVYDRENAAYPSKATVKVWRLVNGERVAYTASARWKEYCPTNERERFMWNKMPYLMLGKCAEALALRKAFPNDLSGVYTEEEMHQSAEPEPGARNGQSPRGGNGRPAPTNQGRPAAPPQDGASRFMTEEQARALEALEGHPVLSDEVLGWIDRILRDYRRDKAASRTAVEKILRRAEEELTRADDATPPAIETTAEPVGITDDDIPF